MSLQKLVPTLLLAISAATAQPALPELHTEPTAGGSVFHVHNGATQPLVAYLIELVDYPGSEYFFWQDETTSPPIAPGTDKRIQVANMTAGAVPEYMKLQAALFADGTTAGVPDRVTQLVARRRFLLETTRELIHRLEKAQTAADLKQWAESIAPPTRSNRRSQAAINNLAAKGLISTTATQLEATSRDAVLASLRNTEHAMSATP